MTRFSSFFKDHQFLIEAIESFQICFFYYIMLRVKVAKQHWICSVLVCVMSGSCGSSDIGASRYGIAYKRWMEAAILYLLRLGSSFL